MDQHPQIIRRKKLQTTLKNLITEATGQTNPNVYFQPPNGTKMQYPCIVYTRDLTDTKYAGNLPYHQTARWTVTVIDRDPDSPINIHVAGLPMCRFSTHFTADNLNHDVYSLYF